MRWFIKVAGHKVMHKIPILKEKKKRLSKTLGTNKKMKKILKDIIYNITKNIKSLEIKLKMCTTSMEKLLHFIERHERRPK